MNTEYALDTARAKTPAERLRIVADLMEAQERGERVFGVDTEGHLYGDRVKPEDAYSSWRYVTKRRPALVLPALELFEGPMREAPELGTNYYVPDVKQGRGYHRFAWAGGTVDLEYLRHGLAFSTMDAAARIPLHIRNELAKAVKS